MVMPGYEDYQKRAFCNDIRCPVQMELNKHSEGSAEHIAIKAICANACLQSANNFILWLWHHNFVIVKENDLDAERDEPVIKALAAAEPTAWRLHRALMQKGFVVVRKRPEI